jgi:magnesium transporter
MIRSFAFTTQGRPHTQDIDMFLMPTILADTNLFLWVDLEKPTAAETTGALENVFHFHPLSIQDCVAPSPVPKVEEYNPQENDQFAPYLFIVIHAVDYNQKDDVFRTSELNFFLGKNFLVTYHDVPLKSTESTVDRCQKKALNVGRGPDRLAHTILDAIVENYKPALDELALEIANLESDALETTGPEILAKIIALKKEVFNLRRIIGPQRAVLARFAHGEFKLIRPHLVPYFRDIYDGIFQIEEMAHSYTDSLTAVLQVYLTMSSNRTGEVVKLLTIITVITTPLMMIGTWYGMNFKNMPELDARHGYAVAASTMLISTAATFYYFKRKKWL